MRIVRELMIGAGAMAALAALALRLLPAPAAPPPVPAVPARSAAAAPAQWLAPLAPPAVPHRQVFAPPRQPVYGRNGRAIDLQGLDVATYVARRASAARTGDARAAYEIYAATSLCAAAADPLPEFDMPAERAQAEAEQGRLRTLCAGVSAAQVQERMTFLARAAEAGKRDAQIDFFTEGPQGRPADLDAQADDPQVREWKTQALDFLQRAGAQCDHLALALLSNAYDLGQLVPRDPRMTMAYAIAEAAARHATLSEAQLRERFGDMLGAADFAAALQEGGTLAREMCPASASP